MGKNLKHGYDRNFFQADIDKKPGKPNFKTQSNKKLFEQLKIANAGVSFNPITGDKKNDKLIDFQEFPRNQIDFSRYKTKEQKRAYRVIFQFIFSCV